MVTAGAPGQLLFVTNPGPMLPGYHVSSCLLKTGSIMFGWGKKGGASTDQQSPELGKKKPTLPTVGFNSTKVTETIKLDLRQNIKALIEVTPADFEMIYAAALRSISEGRALDILCQALMSIKGMTKRRAADISLSLNNKATSLIGAEEQKRNGIQYAVWRHSGAPCGAADETHKAANGKPYLVTKGMRLNGQWTWPGREDGCRCISKSMIAGLDGYAGGKPKGYIE